MATACPLDNTPEFKAIEEKYGYANAHIVWMMSSDYNTMPTVDEAEKIIQSYKSMEPDEIYVASSIKYKYERTFEQNELFLKQRNRLLAEKNKNPKQIATLTKIINRNVEYMNELARQQESLNKNTKLTDNTISVTNYSGASQFNNTSGVDYTMFKEFGIFAHEIIEKIFEKGIEDNVDVRKYFTMELLNELSKSTKMQRYKEIKGLSNEQLFELMQRMMNHIFPYLDKGCVILPEVTVTGKTSRNQTLVGRVDVLIIHPDGEVTKIDFKTKKTYNLLQTNEFGEVYVDNDTAIHHLANTSFEASRTGGAAREYASLGTRTAFDNWIIQQNSYTNLLAQNDIKVKDDLVLTFLYQVDDRLNWTAGSIVAFDNSDFYDRATNVALDNENPNQLERRKNLFGKRLESLKKKTNAAVPKNLNQKQAEEEARKDEAEFEPTTQQMLNFVDKIKKLLAAKSIAVNKSLQDLKNDPQQNEDAIKILEERKKTLRNLEQIVESYKGASENMVHSIRFQEASERISNDIEELSQMSDDAIEKLREDAVNNNLSQKDRNMHMDNLLRAYRDAMTLREVVLEMENIVNQSAKNPGSNIQKNGPLYQNIARYKNRVENIYANWNEIAITNGVSVLNYSGKMSIERVDAKTRELLLPKIAELKIRREKIRSGKGNEVLKGLKSTLLCLVSSTYKKNLEDSLAENGSQTLAELDMIDKQILKYESLLKGLSYSDEDVEQLLNAVLDFKSSVYIGSDSWSDDFYLNTFKIDHLIADASNSDRAIAMVSMIYKDALAEANETVMSDEKLIAFDTLRKQLIKNYSIGQLNDAIREYRTIHFYNRKTKKLDSKRQMFVKKPYSEEYEKVFSQFSGKMKIYKNERDDAKSSWNTLTRSYQNNDKNVTEQMVEDAKKEYIEKKKKYSEYYKRYVNFLIDNVNTEYVPEFYKLQIALPDDIREELEDIQITIDTILINKNITRQNIISFHPDDLRELEEQEFRISRLKQKAKELSIEEKKKNPNSTEPNYADLIDKFKEFYEYDDKANQKYYEMAESNAKIRYAEQPHLLEKWYEENRVYRPKESWYNELNEIYNELSTYYESDKELEDLFEQRRKIMKPFWKNGRLNSHMMTSDEIADYDEVQQKIEDILNPGPDSTRKSTALDLTEEEMDRRNELVNRLRNLKSERPNPRYIRIFDEKTENLKTLYISYKNGEADLEKLVSENASPAEIEKVKQNTAVILNQFNQAEKEYEKWFNENHYTKYESITIDNKDPYSYAVEKKFNRETLPHPNVESEYMEYVPNPRYYRVKIKKPELFNPDYIKPIDGIPLPKNMVEVSKGVYMPKQGYENTTFTYLEDADDGTGKVKQVTSDVFNKELLKLRDNPELFQYYVSILDMFASHQSKVEGRTVGYRVPADMAETIENISEYGLKEAVNRNWQKYLERNLKLTDTAEEYSNNTWGDLESRIRMRYTDQLPENLQSKDVTGAIMKYAVEAHYNMAMQNVVPQVENFLELLKSQRKKLEEALATNTNFIVNERGENVPVNVTKRIKDITAVIDQIEFMQRKFQYGQEEVGTNRVLKKTINKIFGYASFIRIGFDVTNQMKNYLSGNVQAFLAAGFKSDHYTLEDMIWAKGKVYSPTDGYISNYFRDWNKITDLHETTLLYRRMNPLQKDNMKWYDQASGTSKRRMMNNVLNWSELGFSGQEMGDTEIGLSVMAAVMKHYKFPKIKSYDRNTGAKEYETDSEGNTVMVSAIDCYVKNPNGTLSFDANVDYGKKEESFLRNIIYSEIRRAQGNYAQVDKTRFEETVFGRMVFFFRKFLVPQLTNRFGYLRPNWEGSDASYGYWRAFIAAYRIFGPGRTIGEFLVGKTIMSKVFNSDGVGTILEVIDPKTGQIEKIDPGDGYSRKIAHARRDAFAMILTTILSMLALSYVKHKDDDDDELSILEGNLYRIITGVQGETTSMMPLGGGSNEYIRNFTTGIPFVRELTAFKKLSTHALNYAIMLSVYGGDEPDPETDGDFWVERYKDAYFQRKSGNYQEGDPKIVKDLIDLTGIRNFRDLIDPNYRVDQLKRNQ